MTNGYNKAKIEDAKEDIKDIKSELFNHTKENRDDFKKLTKSLDNISNKISFIYGGAAVVGAVASFVVSIISRYLLDN